MNDDRHCQAGDLSYDCRPFFTTVKIEETRNKLRDLMSKADRSEELENVLEQVLQSSDELAQLSTQLGVDKDKDN